MRLGSWSAATKRPFVTASKTFLSPCTGCDKNGEGCRPASSIELVELASFLRSFDVRHGVLVEHGFPSLLCATMWCS